MKSLAAFENLKARLDAYSERQLDEMDKYQNRKVFDETISSALIYLEHPILAQV
jgi:hypothetical protein